MLRLKACDHCGGDLALDTDPGGYAQWTCLQCGRSGGDNGGIPYVFQRGVPLGERGAQRHSQPRFVGDGARGRNGSQ